MACLVCHASLLKTGDLRLKNLARINRVCSHCDLTALEDSRHLVLQCPMLQQERAAMFSEIEQTAGHVEILNITVDIFPYLMGGAIPNVSDELMTQIWKLRVEISIICINWFLT